MYMSKCVQCTYMATEKCPDCLRYYCKIHADPSIHLHMPGSIKRETCKQRSRRLERVFNSTLVAMPHGKTIQKMGFYNNIAQKQNNSLKKRL